MIYIHFFFFQHRLHVPARRPGVACHFRWNYIYLVFVLKTKQKQRMKKETKKYWLLPLIIQSPRACGCSLQKLSLLSLWHVWFVPYFIGYNNGTLRWKQRDANLHIVIIAVILNFISLIKDKHISPKQFCFVLYIRASVFSSASFRVVLMGSLKMLYKLLFIEFKVKMLKIAFQGLDITGVEVNIKRFSVNYP